MRTWEELERLVVGAQIVTIIRSPQNDGIVIITDREHPEYRGEMLAVQVYLEDGQVEVSTAGAKRKVVC